MWLWQKKERGGIKEDRKLRGKREVRERRRDADKGAVKSSKEFKKGLKGKKGV